MARHSQGAPATWRGADGDGSYSHREAVGNCALMKGLMKGSSDATLLHSDEQWTSNGDASAIIPRRPRNLALCFHRCSCHPAARQLPSSCRDSCRLACVSSRPRRLRTWRSAFTGAGQLPLQLPSICQSAAAQLPRHHSCVSSRPLGLRTWRSASGPPCVGSQHSACVVRGEGYRSKRRKSQSELNRLQSAERTARAHSEVQRTVKYSAQ